MNRRRCVPTPGLRPILAGLIVAGVLAVPSTVALAQQAPQANPPASRPGDDTWGGMGLPAPTPGPGFVLPEIPEPGPEAPLSAGPRFMLRDVAVIGNTVLTEADIRTAVAPYVGRVVGTGDLEDMRRALTRLYVDAGYVNSGAVLPDQRIENGRVVVAMVEGRLTDVSVEGTDALAPDYVRARLADLTDLEGRPLNVADLEERLQLLLRDPVIDRVNAALEPGEAPGEALLRARVTEAPPVAIEASVANSESDSVGSERGGLRMTVRNLTGGGDILGFDLGKTRGLDEVSATWSIPLTPSDTRLEVGGEINHADITLPGFEVLDITSRSWTLRLGVTHPLWRTPAEELRVGAWLERRASRTELFDRPFPLAPGTDDGRTDLTILRLTQAWSRADADRAVGLRSTLSFGLPVLGSTDVSGPGPDSSFVAWLGQARVIQRVFDDTRLIGRATVQWANEPLFSMERLAMGGRHSVRGYRENTMVRDAGVVLSAEAEVPLGRVPVPGLGSGADDGQVFVIPFADFARGWNVDGETPDPDVIASVGMGLRWEVTERTWAEVFYGHALTDVDRPGDNIQDLGVHFRVVVGLF
jgi:hemolysin activation/secretion protein